MRTPPIFFLALLLTVTLGLTAQVEYVIGVEGLSCPFCAYGLQKKLKAVDGVQSVSIDMNKGLAVISAGQEIAEKEIRQAVKEAGFTMSSLEKRSPEAIDESQPGDH